MLEACDVEMVAIEDLRDLPVRLFPVLLELVADLGSVVIAIRHVVDRRDNAA
jgi:hypothetical protein